MVYSNVIREIDVQYVDGRKETRRFVREDVAQAFWIAMRSNYKMPDGSDVALAKFYNTERGAVLIEVMMQRVAA